MANERQIHLSHLACTNQIGAEQDRHKGGHNEVVVAVASVVSIRQMDSLSSLFYGLLVRLAQLGSKSLGPCAPDKVPIGPST